jgi:hypothetical protein
MVDLFNAFNAKLENYRHQKIWGTVYRDAGTRAISFTPTPPAYALNEILNPRVMRLGVRFQF